MGVKYRIYQAAAIDRNPNESVKESAKTAELEWVPTEMVYDSYDDAYIKRYELATKDILHIDTYYKVIKEEE